MKSQFKLLALLLSLAFSGTLFVSCNEEAVTEEIKSGNDDAGFSTLEVNAGPQYTVECEPKCPDNETECKKKRGTANYPGYGPVTAYFCSCEGCKLLLKQGTSVQEIDPEDFYGDVEYPKFADEFEQVANAREGGQNYQVKKVVFQVFDNGDGTESYVVEYVYDDDHNEEKNIALRVDKTVGGGFEPSITAYWCEPPCETSCLIAYCCSLDFFCTCAGCNLQSANIPINL